VEGLTQLGPKLTIVSDAIADIGDDADAIRHKWRHAGIEFATVAELKELIPA
jgi:hypothetical protein